MFVRREARFWRGADKIIDLKALLCLRLPISAPDPSRPHCISHELRLLMESIGFDDIDHSVIAAATRGSYTDRCAR